MFADGCLPATFLIETESRNAWANSKQNMAAMASDSPSPHSPPLHLGLPAPQPSKRYHAQSLLGPSFHDLRTHHVLESQPEQATPLSRRDNERRYAIGAHLARALHCASILHPTTPLQVVVLESKTISDPICFNCFTFAASRNPNLWICVFINTFSFCAFAFLIELDFSCKFLFAICSLSP